MTVLQIQLQIFQREFGELDEVEKTIQDISSISVLEEISSALGELTNNLQEIVDDTTVRIEEIEGFEEEDE
jgi:hypothetical protein